MAEQKSILDMSLDEISKNKYVCGSEFALLALGATILRTTLPITYTAFFSHPDRLDCSCIEQHPWQQPRWSWRTWRPGSSRQQQQQQQQQLGQHLCSHCPWLAVLARMSTNQRVHDEGR
jgi:hypothetical protein